MSATPSPRGFNQRSGGTRIGKSRSAPPGPGTHWTNHAVLRLAGVSDPVLAIVDHARKTVSRALSAGWGPPFDPIDLASTLGLTVVPNDDIALARTVAAIRRGDEVEFNPNREFGRVRCAIAHEIARVVLRRAAHASRPAASNAGSHDDWQFEAMCSIASYEFLLPLAEERDLGVCSLTATLLVEASKRLNVSAEALFGRAAGVADLPCAMFCASQAALGSETRHFRVDYLVTSSSWREPSFVGALLPRASIVGGCTAIGQIACGLETCGPFEGFSLECVGVPPYPGCSFPRVIGILRKTISIQSGTPTPATTGRPPGRRHDPPEQRYEGRRSDLD